MKPKQAKEISSTRISGEGFTEFPLDNNINWIINRSPETWKCLQAVIDGIELAGYNVSITKDGKEYNK